MCNTRPTVAIFTLGCKVNQYESEAIAELLEQKGFDILPPSAVADAYIINTCTVTAESDRKARQFIRRAIAKNPSAYILVTGCYAQTSPMEIAKIQGVDYISGNTQKTAVTDALDRLLKSGKKNDIPKIVHASLEGAGFEKMNICKFERTRAYIKIEDGCENHCTYCIIPQARGPVRSKAPLDVLAEAQNLTMGGCRELVLTGIETASWGKDIPDWNLAKLLCEIDRIPGIGRVRLGSLDPSMMKEELVQTLAGLSSLAPHFHLSLQSGSDKILALMKRKYNTKQAKAAMELLRKYIPNVQFTTDIIVGFPGETEEDFKETLEFVKSAGFLMIHVFPYSPRNGTPAAAMKEQIPEEEKHRRVQKLSQIAAEIRKNILNDFTKKTAMVLFETYKSGTAIGHTSNFLEVSCLSPTPLHGEIRTVRIIGNDGNICFGEIINESEENK